MPSCLIVGGGVIGCALARELARRDVQVTLLEAGASVASESSGAALGTLSYSPGASMPEPWHRLAAQSLKAHRALSLALASELDNPPEWHWPGRLSLAMTHEAEKHARSRLKADLALGDEGQWLDRQALRQLEPALAPRVIGASFKPDQGWVNAAELTRALARSAEQAGAAIHPGSRVEQLLWNENRLTGVLVRGREHRADHVVLAAGAWSGRLDPRLKIPIEPVRGQAVYLDLSEISRPGQVGHLVSGQGIYLFPEGQGVSIGSTHERVGFSTGVTAGGIAKLTGNAIKLVPSLADAGWSRARIWSGLRPATPDDVPVLGPDPRYPGLWWATGHFRSGILLAPVTATLLADAILGNGEVEPAYLVTRFV
jgi:glycine oxidase